MNEDIFAALAAPLDPSRIKTRKQKDTTIRYIDARTVIDRLNEVVPGQWHFTTELLHVPTGEQGSKWVFKGRLVVLDCVQEDVGMNDNEDYFDPPKSAVSDALKRCAVHFGIGTELYGNAAPSAAKDSYSKPKPAVKPLSNASADDTVLPFAPDKVLNTFEQRDWTAFWPFMAKHVGKKPSELHAFLHEITGVESMKDCGLTFGELMSAVDN